MHASGGISSGLGGLLVIFVGAGEPRAAGCAGRVALRGARDLRDPRRAAGSRSSTGISRQPLPGRRVSRRDHFRDHRMAAQPLARRMQASEALARQRGVDLANLSELNDYIVQHLRESIVVVDARRSDPPDQRARPRASAGSADRPSGDPLAEPVAAISRAYIAAGALEAKRRVRRTPNRARCAGENSAPSRRTWRRSADGSDAAPMLIFLEDASLMNARVQQSKLASLGRLSASIAHEIRNPVGAMSHAAQLLRRVRTSATTTSA